MAVSRHRLVTTGIEVALRGDEDALARILKTDTICREANLSRRTFYDQFAAASEFRDAVMAAIRSDGGGFDADADADAFDLDGSLAAGADVADILRAICTSSAAASARVERARFWASDLASPSQPAIATLLAAIEEAGFRPAVELDRSTIGLAVEALFHAHLRGQMAEADMIVTASTLLSAVYVRRDLTSELDSAAAALAAELRASRLHPAGELVLNLRRLVVDATLEAIEGSGPDRVTLDDVARRVGISAGAIAVTMGSVVDLATAGLEELAFALTSPLQADIADGLDWKELAARHVDRLTKLLGARPRLCELVLLADSRGDVRPLRVLTDAGSGLVEARLMDHEGLERATLVLATLVRRGDPVDWRLFCSIATGRDVP